MLGKPAMSMCQMMILEINDSLWGRWSVLNFCDPTKVVGEIMMARYGGSDCQFAGFSFFSYEEMSRYRSPEVCPTGPN